MSRVSSLFDHLSGPSCTVDGAAVTVSNPLNEFINRILGTPETSQADTLIGSRQRTTAALNKLNMMEDSFTSLKPEEISLLSDPMRKKLQRSKDKMDAIWKQCQKDTEAKRELETMELAWQNTVYGNVEFKGTLREELPQIQALLRGTEDYPLRGSIGHNISENIVRNVLNDTFKKTIFSKNSVEKILAHLIGYRYNTWLDSGIGIDDIETVYENLYNDMYEHRDTFRLKQKHFNKNFNVGEVLKTFQTIKGIVGDNIGKQLRDTIKYYLKDLITVSNDDYLPLISYIISNFGVEIKIDTKMFISYLDGDRCMDISKKSELISYLIFKNILDKKQILEAIIEHLGYVFEIESFGDRNEGELLKKYKFLMLRYPKISDETFINNILEAPDKKINEFLNEEEKERVKDLKEYTLTDKERDKEIRHIKAQIESAKGLVSLLRKLSKKSALFGRKTRKTQKKKSQKRNKARNAKTARQTN